MPVEALILAELPKVVTPTIAFLLQHGVKSFLQFLQANPHGDEIGQFDVRGTSHEIRLDIPAGPPLRGGEFEERTIRAGGFNWHIYMRISGNWKKRISGGIVIATDCSIYGPLCPINAKPTLFSMERNWIGIRKWKCNDCGHIIPYADPADISKDIAHQLDILSKGEFKI